jgi:prolipoprotein diacylglyceryltransferase
VHPTQLYSALTCFLIFLVLVTRSSKEKRFPGALFIKGTVFYIVAQSVIDYLRDDLQKVFPLGLASAQWVGIVSFFLLILLYIYLAKRKSETPCDSQK